MYISVVFPTISILSPLATFLSLDEEDTMSTYAHVVQNEIYSCICRFDAGRTQEGEHNLSIRGKLYSSSPYFSDDIRYSYVALYTHILIIKCVDTIFTFHSHHLHNPSQEISDVLKQMTGLISYQYLELLQNQIPLQPAQTVYNDITKHFKSAYCW